MSNLVKIELSVDASNSLHVVALTNFLSAIGGIGGTGKEMLGGYTAGFTKEVEPIVNFQVLDPEVEPKLEPKKRTKKAEFKNPEKEGSAVDAYEAAKAIEVVGEEVVGEEVVGEKNVKTLIEVRALLSEKRENNMPALRAKLAEFNASSVTLMESKDYDAFYEFMKTLK
jgi:hypothetical protein